MPTPSPLAVLHNGADITDHVQFAQSSFELQANALPGQASVMIRDTARSLSFTTGDTIVLTIDGVRLWGGLIMSIEEGYYFPVADTRDLSTVPRRWVLRCTDFNIYMDKRVCYDPNNLISLPGIGPALCGNAIKAAIPLYMDDIPGFDFTTYVEATDSWYSSNNEPDGGPGILVNNAGDKWRVALDSAARRAEAFWFIDAYLRLHFQRAESLVAPWLFTDRPTHSNTVGFRDGTYTEDGSLIVTDALIWGGSALQGGQAEFFGRYPDPPANDETFRTEFFSQAVEQRAIDNITRYGRWQTGEIHFGPPYLKEVDAKLRAARIVAGNTGVDENGVQTGLNQPLQQINLTWFAHDVPSAQHIVPGMISSFIFYSLGDDGAPLSVPLPLRSMRITFPTLPADNPTHDMLTFASFTGQFGISYSDQRYLWRFLKAQQQSTATSGGVVVSTTTDESTGTTYGAEAQLTPVLDFSRTIASLPYGYISGTTKVYVNGLLWRPRIEYIESSPELGEITFFDPLEEDDTLWVECRTLAV